MAGDANREGNEWLNEAENLKIGRMLTSDSWKQRERVTDGPGGGTPVSKAS